MAPLIKVVYRTSCHPVVAPRQKRDRDIFFPLPFLCKVGSLDLRARQAALYDTFTVKTGVIYCGRGEACAAMGGGTLFWRNKERAKGHIDGRGDGLVL